MFSKKLAAWIAALVVIASLVSATPAQAEVVTSIFGLTGKVGTNSGKSMGNLYLKHPDFVMCMGTLGTSTACNYQLVARVDNVAVLPVTINVLTGGSQLLGSATIYTANTYVDVNVAASSNGPVYYAISTSSPYVSGSRDYMESTTLQVTGTPIGYSLPIDYGSNADQYGTRTYNVSSKLIFMQAGFASLLHTEANCTTVTVLASPVDYFTGKPANALQLSDIDFEIYIIDSANVTSANKVLSSALGTWNRSGFTTKSEFEVCNIDPTINKESYLQLRTKATLRFQGKTYTSSASDQIVIRGTAPLKQIACSKGQKAIIVTSAFPKCPVGFSLSAIPIINGKLKTTTITCIKGLTLKKVTSVIPSCPTGYRRR